MAILKIENLKKEYTITKTQNQSVLEGINIEFKSGDLVALLGESGCGKTTLINILAGLDQNYSGSVIVKGKFLRDFNEKQMDDYRKKMVGLIFQNYNLISHMTVFENVEVAMILTDVNEKVRKERTKELLEMVGLLDCANKMPNQLSGGQKQRIAIARTLANNPTIIFADEPTGALDKESATIIMQILKKIAESGKLVIIVTHSQKVAGECGRVIKMDDGKIVEDKVVNKIKIATTRDKEITPKNVKIKEITKLAFGNLKHNKKRNLIVAIGMSVSIVLMVLILCLSGGVSNYISALYKQEVRPLQISVTKKTDKGFSEKEIEKIKNVYGVQSVKMSYTLENVQFKFNNENSLPTGLGMFVQSFQPELLHGSEPTENGDIIISEAFALKLLEQKDDSTLISLIGEKVTINKGIRKFDFTIKGIFGEIGSKGKISALTTKEGLLNIIEESELTPNLLFVLSHDVFYTDSVISDIQKLGYVANLFNKSGNVALEYINTGTSALTFIAGISMFISAILIFIVLHISVTERTKEIGILRSIGARKKDIRNIFIFESVMLGVIAGLFAICATLCLTLLINIITSITLSTSFVTYNVWYYLLGLVSSTLIGLIAGAMPAVKAANLDPIEALRQE